MFIKVSIPSNSLYIKCIIILLNCKCQEIDYQNEGGFSNENAPME